MVPNIARHNQVSPGPGKSGLTWPAYKKVDPGPGKIDLTLASSKNISYRSWYGMPNLASHDNVGPTPPVHKNVSPRLR